jgi:ubiquinone/menaquinone biosynthesis C-methylase UbiE
MPYRNGDRMFDLGFNTMTLLYRVRDLLLPTVVRRVESLGIQPGMTVVDYGCGPGRYIPHYSRRVGPGGRVFAVDVHELAMRAVQRKVERYKLENVTPLLAQGYRSGVPNGIAHLVTAFDMFFFVEDPTALLNELRRILRPHGLLAINDGFQRRETTQAKIAAAGGWEICEESGDLLKYRSLL